MNLVNLMSLDSHKYLEPHTQDIRDLTTKVIESESDDSMVQVKLELCAEQKFRVFQIRKAISSYFENEDVSPINLNKKRNSLSLDVVSHNNSLSTLKNPSQTENKDLLTNRTLNTRIKDKNHHRSICKSMFTP